MDEATRLVGQIVGSAVIVLLAGFGLLRFVGEKWFDSWLENKFAQRLENLKHEHDKELEDHRHKINALFNRITKIHEREIEVLPTAWENLVNADGALRQVDSAKLYYIDLVSMSEEGVKTFLLGSGFSAEEQRLIHDAIKIERSSRGENHHSRDVYLDVLWWHNLDLADHSYATFHSHLAHNSIFLGRDLAVEFEAVSNVMRQTLAEKQAIRTSKSGPTGLNDSKAFEKIDAIKLRIGDLVQQRLHFEEAD